MKWGESLRNWCFRLNGFLPLPSILPHRPDVPRRHDSGSSLLAAGIPYVFEDVGGQAHDWDNERFAKKRRDHFKRKVGVIVDIETGRYFEASVNRAFRLNRVHYALRRLGAIAQPECEDLCRRLPDDGVVHHRAFCFVKVLVDGTRGRASD